jgi:selenocysteine lyase/cysteine desulfurase
MGLQQSIDFISEIGIQKVANRGKELGAYLIKELRKINQVEVLTPEDPQYYNAIITFRLKDRPYNKVQESLLKNYKCRVRGIFEANLNAIRIAIGIYNDYEDLNKLIYGVQQIAKG